MRSKCCFPYYNPLAASSVSGGKLLYMCKNMAIVTFVQRKRRSDA